MDSKKRRARAREKSRRQAARKHGVTYQSETPIGMLRNFLPEARSGDVVFDSDYNAAGHNIVIRLRGELERREGFLQKGWAYLAALWRTRGDR